MAFLEISYSGDLRCEAVHGSSGSILQTDVPKDQQGKGEAFSPSDLLALSLASCILSTMALLARRLEIDMAGATAKVDKTMSTEGPRRIAALPVTIVMPSGIKVEDRAKLERAAWSCPVAKSLHPDVQKTIAFQW